MTAPTPFSPGQAEEAASSGGGVSLAEVLALIATLADEVRAAHAEGAPVPKERAGALIAAAQLLRAHELDWPPSLAPALTDLAEMFGRAAPGAQGEAMDPAPEAEDPTPAALAPATAARSRMMRLMGALRPGRVTP